MFILVPHINALQNNNNLQQKLFIANSNSKNVFKNIPLHKVGNHVLKFFLEKHTSKSIPDENKLKINYILNIYIFLIIYTNQKILKLEINTGLNIYELHFKTLTK